MYELIEKEIEKYEGKIEVIKEDEKHPYYTSGMRFKLATQRLYYEDFITFLKRIRKYYL